MVSGFKFQVSGFRFQVSSFRFQVSGFRFQVSGLSVGQSYVMSPLQGQFIRRRSFTQGQVPVLGYLPLAGAGESGTYRHRCKPLCWDIQPLQGFQPNPQPTPNPSLKGREKESRRSGSFFLRITNAYIRCGRIANPTEREGGRKADLFFCALQMLIFVAVGLQIRPSGDRACKSDRAETERANPTERRCKLFSVKTNCER